MKTLFLYGRNSVVERLKADPASVEEVWVGDDSGLSSIMSLVRQNNIPVRKASRKDLARAVAGVDTKGILAKVKRFGYADFEDLLDNTERSAPSIIFLDRIYDPHNLGAVIRTAACFGKFAVVLPRFRACGITMTALHVASGGENYVPVSVVSNLSKAIVRAKRSGYWIAGASADGGGKKLNEISFPFPLGIVLGSEGEGIRHGLEKHIDMKLYIPMEGAGLSFNVSAACAILCYEIYRQRKGP